MAFAKNVMLGCPIVGVYQAKNQDEIMKATHGAGIDVVLNSLTGEFISQSLAVLRPGGRFVEIGQAGVWDEQFLTEKPQCTWSP